MCNPLQKLPLLLFFRLPLIAASLCLSVRLTTQAGGQRLQSHSQGTVQHAHAPILSSSKGLLVQTPGSMGPSVTKTAPLPSCSALSLITAYWRAD